LRRSVSFYFPDAKSTDLFYFLDVNLSDPKGAYRAEEAFERDRRSCRCEAVGRFSVNAVVLGVEGVPHLSSQPRCWLKPPVGVNNTGL